jgi:enamine deaminase RidA (YjgF/YER057c/UK114 family)
LPAGPIEAKTLFVTTSRADRRRQRIARATHVLDVTFVGAEECHLVAAALPGFGARQVAEAIYADVASVLAHHALQPVHERVFGSVAVAPEVLEARGKAGDALCDVAPTYIEGGPCTGPGLAGIELHAVRPAHPDDHVWTVRAADRSLGRAWTRGGATHLVLQGIRGSSGSPTAEVPRPEQAGLMLDRAQRLLDLTGSSYGHVVRTWIYLADILDWYADFNRVRNRAYGDLGLTGNAPRLPASTGISGRNPAGAACVMDVRAIPNGPTVSFLGNRHQEDAIRYGSAFSRAALWEEGTCRHLLVSGTASIDEQGRTCFPGNVAAQAHHTLENVEALLRDCSLRWDDVAASTVFLKHPQDLATYRAVAAQHGIAEVPQVVVVADVCRPDLLFEIEVTAGRG